MHLALRVIDIDHALIPVNLKGDHILLGIQFILHLDPILNIEGVAAPRAVTAQAAQYRPDGHVGHAHVVEASDPEPDAADCLQGAEYDAPAVEALVQGPVAD